MNENVSKSVLPYNGRIKATLPSKVPYGCILPVAEVMDNLKTTVLTNVNEYAIHSLPNDMEVTKVESVKGDARVATTEGT